MRWYADDKGVIFHCKCHRNVIIRAKAGGGAMQQRQHGCCKNRRSERGATLLSAALARGGSGRRERPETAFE